MRLLHTAWEQTLAADAFRERVFELRYPVRVLEEWSDSSFDSLIDSPDFNLGLARKLRRWGVRTVHFVSPSVWAWRAERLQSIGRAVDRMLVLFPFEPPLYERAAIPVTFVGHPLASQAEKCCRTTYVSTGHSSRAAKDVTGT